MSSDSICLDHPGDYYCVLDKDHDGPHRAMRVGAEEYPGCVWEDQSDRRVSR